LEIPGKAAGGGDTTIRGTTWPLQGGWRGALLLVAAVGIVAIGAGAARLAGVGEIRMSSGEAVAALVAGSLIQPFLWSTLRHGRLRLADGELAHLRLGLVSSTGRIRLDEIARLAIDRRRGLVRRTGVGVAGDEPA
jgi:hypothetical protein